jgi:uncharacterized protein involved in outer membrane biogenesis
MMATPLVVMAAPEEHNEQAKRSPKSEALEPLQLPGFDLNILLEGIDPADLARLLPVSLPHLPPYRFEGRLTHVDNNWSIHNLSGTVGSSDVSGDLILNTAGERMLLQGNLASELVDLVQLFGEPEQDKPLIPDTPIDLSYLDVLDALVLYKAARIKTSEITFDDVLAEISLRDGEMSIKPFEFGLVDGTIDGTFEVAAQAAVMDAALDVAIRQVDISKVLAQLGVEGSAFGIIGGEIHLMGSGSSPANALASANGSVYLVMEDGRVDALLLEMAGMGLGEALVMIGGNEQDTVEIRCLVADFKVQEGVMTTETLIMDTGDARITGHGTINLGSPQFVDIMLVQRDKDFSLMSGQAPLHVRGTIGDLSINVNAGPALFSLLTPIDLGIAHDADCRQLIEAVRQR